VRFLAELSSADQLRAFAVMVVVVLFLGGWGMSENTYGTGR